MSDESSSGPVIMTGLDRRYQRLLAILTAATRHPWRLAAVTLPAVFAVLAAINQFVLLDFPNSGDEYAYLYQARTLAAGRLSNPPTGHPDLFAFNYIVHEPARVFGSFPLGWPLMLAIGLWMGLPAWAVNPLLGVLTLVAVAALGWRLHSPRAGLVAALIVGVSPFFLFNAASYFSHTFCGLLLVTAAWVAARADRRPAWVPVTIGLLIGWAVLARYLTGVIGAVPIIWWLLRPGTPRLRTLLLVAVGGLPWVAALMAYNDALTGSPWALTTRPLTMSLWFAEGMWLRGADILATHVLRHLSWTPPLLIVAYMLYLRRAAPVARRGLFPWVLVMTAAVLYFYVERGGNQYGPRFHYEAWLFAAVFGAANLVRHDTVPLPRFDRRMFGLFVASVLVMPVALMVHAVREHRVITERSDVFAKGAAVAMPALIFLRGRVGTARSMAVLDLTRNGLDLAAPVLYAVDPGARDARCDAARRLGGRSVYLYDWDVAARQGSLQPVACARSAETRR
ncbi:MAG: hypothetical protein IT178_19645 [Acidobacteria bacterium]|nr:hypothetical protein [Acidobacteriota bacterium]